MSFAFINDLFEFGDGLSSSEFWVLMAICHHVNASEADRSGSCFPSTARISAKAHVSELTVRKTIKALEAKGLIKTSQPSGGRRTFIVSLDAIRSLPGAELLKDPKGGKDLDPPKDVDGGKEVAPPKDVEGDPVKIFTSSPSRSLPTPLKDLYHEHRKEQGIEQGREQGSFSPAFACDAPAEGVAHKTGVTPSPDDWASLLAEPAPVEDDYPADLFSDVDPATAKVPAPKPRTNARTSSSSTSSRAKPKRLCPFDLDAVIPDEWRDAFAADYPTLDLAAEFRKFVGWHVAKGNTYADWKAAFRNWLGNAVKFQARDRNYLKDNRHDVQASRQGSILTPQSEYDYAEGLRIFEARRAARRARDA